MADVGQSQIGMAEVAGDSVSAEVRVLGMRQGTSFSCIRDFPKGCGSDAVLDGLNSKQDSVLKNVLQLDPKNPQIDIVMNDVGRSQTALVDVAVGFYGGSVSAEILGRASADKWSRLSSELTFSNDRSKGVNTGDRQRAEVPAGMFISEGEERIQCNETVETAEETSTSIAVFTAGLLAGRVMESDLSMSDSLSSSKTSCAEGTQVIDHRTVRIENSPMFHVVADPSHDEMEKMGMETTNIDTLEIPIKSSGALLDSNSLEYERRMMVKPPEVGKANDFLEQCDRRPESELRTETIMEPLGSNLLIIEPYNERNDCLFTLTAYGTKGIARRGKIPARKSTNKPPANIDEINTITKRKSCDAHKDEQAGINKPPANIDEINTITKRKSCDAHKDEQAGISKPPENIHEMKSITKGKSYDAHKDDQARINKDQDSLKVDACVNTFIVQALMAADKCPWRLGLRRGSSSSQSATPKVKVKKEKTSNAKELTFNKQETEEGSTPRDAENKIALVGFQQPNEFSITVPPITPAASLANTSVALKIKTKRGRKSNAKKLAFNKVEDEDSTFREEETGNTPAVFQQSSKFSITMPPITAAADLADVGRLAEDVTPRQIVKRALKLFNTIYRKLLHQEESMSKRCLKKRSDLAAADKMKELKAFVNKNSGGIVGDVPGVEVGDEFGCRVELAVVGLHRIYQAGIDSVKRDGLSIAASVVSTEGYADDMETLDVLIYTGSGGKPATAGREAEDQKLEHGNLALKNSISERTPVRVIVGYKAYKEGICYSNKKPKAVSTFTYAGLYHVEKYWQVQGSEGFHVFKFKLVRIPGQPELALDLVKKSTKSKVREGQCVSDISEGKEKSSICAINTEGNDLPQPFKYITQMKYPSSYDIAPAKGCDCIGNCKDSGKCSCAVKNGGEIPYNRNGAIVLAKRLVYECGPSCKCSKSCPNRVSQNGIKIPLELFKTKTRGWGVRSLSSITSGTFICEYVGELIEDKEAEKRSNDEYFFDIGNNYEDNSLWDGIPGVSHGPESCPSPTESGGFTIDALEYGNVGRFINHSCTPNLYAQTVLFDHDDKRMPHIMFFATENIPPLQELTYHYNYAVDQILDEEGNVKRKDCYCGSAECTGRLY